MTYEGFLLFLLYHHHHHLSTWRILYRIAALTYNIIGICSFKFYKFCKYVQCTMYTRAYRLHIFIKLLIKLDFISIVGLFAFWSRAFHLLCSYHMRHFAHSLSCFLSLSLSLHMSMYIYNMHVCALCIHIYIPIIFRIHAFHVCSNVVYVE